VFTSQVWVHGEMDPTREFITTNEFWDVEGFDTCLTKKTPCFKLHKLEWRFLSIEEKAIWKVQL
jgi:hypothetical protein